MTPLCRLEEIEDGEARGFDLGRGAEPREILVLRQGAAVFGYVNACPHLGVPLEFLPDRFLTADGRFLLCATHGAIFRKEDGFCLAGPCSGQALRPVPLRLDAEGRVFLA